MRRSLQYLSFFVTCVFAACSQPVRPVPLVAQAPIAPTPAATPLLTASSSVAQPDPGAPVLSAEKRQAFIAETAAASGMSEAEVSRWLDEARYQQSIINAITRPAEGKPWKDYRPIFLTEPRISQGREFFAEHRADLQRVSSQTGVPAEIITAIIGVETSYGRIMGNYRVLDALYTLGFFYPRREEFFRGELKTLFTLAKREGLDLSTLKGSYAGAMGWGQFMPSSYLEYARDGDGDGRRDLRGSPRDAIASVANYFVGHGWKPGQPAFVPAVADANAQAFVPPDFIARHSLADLAQRGYRPRDANAPPLMATLLTLQGANGPEHWIGYPNFYVITRYNRSPMYAMAVHQLAQEIAAGAGSPP